MDQPWVSPQTVAQAREALCLLWPRDLEGRMLIASAVVDPDHPEGPVVAWGEVIGVPSAQCAQHTLRQRTDL